MSPPRTPQNCLALVLRTVDFSETSLIVTLLTRERGRIQAMAKGARRLRGAFGSSLELLSLCRIVVLLRSGDALDLLTEADQVDSFPAVRGDLAAMYSGLYMAEVTAALVSDHDPHPGLFDAARSLLERLGPGSPAELLFAFELTCLGELGYMPTLERCANCQRSLGEAESAYFWPGGGGAICRGCRPRVKTTLVFSPAARTGLARLAAASSDADEPPPLAPAVRREIRALLGRYVSNLMGRRPKTLELLTAAAFGEQGAARR